MSVHGLFKRQFCIAFTFQTLFTDCCGSLNVTVTVEDTLDKDTSGEYVRIQQLIRGRTAYVRNTPEKMYLIYHFDAWKISSDPLLKKNPDQIISLEGKAHSCPEIGSNRGKYYIRTEPTIQEVNIACLGTKYHMLYLQ